MAHKLQLEIPEVQIVRLLTNTHFIVLYYNIWKYSTLFSYLIDWLFTYNDRTAMCILVLKIEKLI